MIMSTSRFRLAVLFALVLTLPALAQGPVTLVWTANVLGYVEPCG